MLSFHNDPEIKYFYISRIKKHIKLNHLVQGIDYEIVGGEIQGSAVFCTLENDDYSYYPKELGLPVWLAKLEDTIFEFLPLKEAILFAEKFLFAIPVGVCVEKVKYQLTIRRLNRLINMLEELLESNQFLKDILLQSIHALNSIKKCYEAKIIGENLDFKSPIFAAKRTKYAIVREQYAQVELRTRSGSTKNLSALAVALSAIYSSISSPGKAARSAAWASVRKETGFLDPPGLAEAVSKSWAAAWQQEASDLLELLAQLKKED